MKTRKEQIFDKHKIKKWKKINNLKPLGTYFEQAVFPNINTTSAFSQELKCFNPTSSTSECELTDYRNQLDENQKLTKYRIGPSRTETDFSKNWKHQYISDFMCKTPEKTFESTNFTMNNGKEDFSKPEIEIASIPLDKIGSKTPITLLEQPNDRIKNGLNNAYSLEQITLSQIPAEDMNIIKNALTEEMENIQDIRENTKVERNRSTSPTGKKSDTLINLCDNIERIKSALRMDENKLTYENMEHDIKDMIDDLLLHSALIKESVVGTGIQENDTPPVLFSFYTDDSRNTEDVQWLMDEILNSVFENSNLRKFNDYSKNENAGDANKQNNSEKGKSLKTANDLHELGATQPCNEPIFTKTQTYFCTANLNKIPKTSWTFGESQLHKTKKNSDKSEDIFMQSLDKCSDMFKLIFQDNQVHNSNKYIGGKSVEQLKSPNFDELSNFDKRFSNSDQIVCILKSSKKGSNIAFKSVPQMQKSTKNFDVTKNFSQPVPVTEHLSTESLEEVLRNEYLTSDHAACSTSNAILPTQNQISKKYSFRSHISNSYVSSSSSEEIVRRHPVKKRKFSLESITKLLKPKPKFIRSVSKMDLTTSAENSPRPGPTDTDYEGETEEVRVDFPRPKIKHRTKSEPELNTPSEIRMIEKNVLLNDGLERRGCLVLGKPVVNFDSNTSFNHSNYSDITLQRQSL